MIEYYRTKVEKDLEAIKAHYPFTVQRIDTTPVNAEIGDWMMDLGDDMIVLSSIRIGPPQNFSPRIIFYGFKKEADALAFKLRFPDGKLS